MTPNIFIAGQDYRDRIRYLEYGGGQVTIVDPPGGARLVCNLLNQLNSIFSIAPEFIKPETDAAIQTALEVEQLAPRGPLGHRVKSRLQLKCKASDTGESSARKIQENDLLILVNQHDVGSYEVDPWYWIFQRSGSEIEPSQLVLKELQNYAASSPEVRALAGWKSLGVIIDAEYLRWKHLEISRHLSWAQTCEDFLRNFVFAQSLRPELKAFRKASHFIARFDCDGVIHVDNTTTEPRPTIQLYVQKSENSEGDFVQSTPGRTPAIAAGFVAGLLGLLAQDKPDYKDAIQFGLLVSQKAAKADINIKSRDDQYYELSGITSSDFPSGPFSGGHSLAVPISVPSSEILNKEYRWSILQTLLETEPAYQELGGTIEQSITDLAQAIVPPEETIENKITNDKFPTLYFMLPNDKRTSLEASLKEFLPKQAKSNTTELQAEVKALFVDSHTAIDVESFRNKITEFIELLITSREGEQESQIRTLLEVALPTADFTNAKQEIENLAKETVKPLESARTKVANKIAALAHIILTHRETRDTLLQRNTKALAEKIVKKGSVKALAGIPTARFGNLMTADRQEKESFRAIANLVTEYLRSPQEKPISIGVFGAPGSGKSFGIKEVVNAVAQRVSNGGKRVSKPLTFNLSQFREYHDLVVAFHTVRDSGLSNEVPLVLFDEFDSGFGQTKLGWLQYLLAPMQDGKFLEDGHQRPLGSAIFVFIGGTCSTFEDFTTDLATKDAKDAKKPDFVSRLRGFVNIQGSHQSPRDTDYMYLVRRGIHLRAMLQNRLGCKADEEIQLDDGVLNALLTVPQFRHGARSLESIIAMSQLHGQKIFRRSALPSAQQLGLHVDYTTFVESFEPENHRAIARVKIAERIRILGRLPPEDDFRQRIAGQILDMIYNNGAYLVPQPPNESSPEDAEDHPKRKALVNDLAKYRYYAVNLHNSISAWGARTTDRNTYIAAANSLLELLKGCGFAVRKGS